MLYQQEILELLNKHLPVKDIYGMRSMPGGCSDYTIKVNTNEGLLFLKYYSQQSSEVEAKGLSLLQSTRTVPIADVIGYGTVKEFNYLILEFIEPGERDNNYWIEFGEQLAELHRVQGQSYGLEFENYIGRLPQINQQEENWVDFFIQHRLLAQLKLVRDQFSKEDLLAFDKLFKLLPELLPTEVPSLIHGDLWSGNILVDKEGKAILIDPAVYYGHREIEIAFTKLFGGFPEEFYTSYYSAFPLLPGFELRTDIYNLYPLLVHANMFGGGYLHQVSSILKRIVK